ncbi:HEPN domain-containing protein [Marinicella meishanensis]|uniref:HEPN domain-containing protein n=1 Tax=Marinicella meishanensis TaxID=2873263 RepID=UPI001CBCBD8F|nr:HEPN domain-containing protein [Marinicella sp. NBU2979]
MENNTEIPPAAEENFNKKAKALIKLIKEVEFDNQGDANNSDLHSRVTITDKDIVGEVEMFSSNEKGKVMGRFFKYMDSHYGIVDDDFEKLRDVSQNIQRLNAFKLILSQNFIENHLFNWCVESFKAHAITNPFIEYLKLQAEAAVKEQKVYVPIANLIVDKEFKFCGVLISGLTKPLADEIYKSSISMAKNEGAKSRFEKFFDNFRSKYQGYALALLKFKCEPELAHNLATNKVQRLISILSIYHRSILIHDIKCPISIKGSEYSPYTTSFEISDEFLLLSLTEKPVDLASLRPWRIKENDVIKFNEVGMSHLSVLASQDNKTEFQDMILNMAYLYSKASFSNDPMEKLILMLSSLESSLLKNQSESIQQNIAERLSMLIAEKLQDRKAIIKNLKEVYSLRSKYLHHGHSSQDIKNLSQFFLNMWVFYVQLITSEKHAFKTKAEFLEYIDDYKLSH